MHSSSMVRLSSVHFAFLLQSCTALRMVRDMRLQDQGTSQKPFWKTWGKDETKVPEMDTFDAEGMFKNEGDLVAQVELLNAEVQAAQRPVEAKIAEITSLEKMASQIAEQHAELETEIEQLSELDSTKDEEIVGLKNTLEDVEASKRAAAEQRVEHMASRGDTMRQGEEALAAIKDLDRQRT
eukprot:CAMPEP_0194486290 /NCGR_PEP_ID=MMETSP0253-20130528/7004_1 /TAXON_ID=2966 /ORGANISM="Noctiluca scintillans" /LENGTH=181 /DNA_ID=CAMNT_0039326367 /DNA_START=47 /DNA_END=588 /DNA_ORIENTATION=-